MTALTARYVKISSGYMGKELPIENALFESLSVETV